MTQFAVRFGAIYSDDRGFGKSRRMPIDVKKNSHDCDVASRVHTWAAVG